MEGPEVQALSPAEKRTRGLAGGRQPRGPGQGTVSDNHAEVAAGADDGADVVPLLASPLPCSFGTLRLAWTGPRFPMIRKQQLGRDRPGAGNMASAT